MPAPQWRRLSERQGHRFGLASRPAREVCPQFFQALGPSIPATNAAVQRSAQTQARPPWFRPSTVGGETRGSVDVRG
jgi:hypothetical protein